MKHTPKQETGWVVVELIMGILLSGLIVTTLVQQWVTHTKALKTILHQLECKLERDTIQLILHQDIVTAKALTHMESTKLSLLSTNHHNITYDIKNNRLRRRINRVSQYLTDASEPQSIHFSSPSPTLLKIQITYPNTRQTWMEIHPHDDP